MFHTLQPLILASSSPRRIEYLTHLGITFDIIPADIDETPQKLEKPKLFVQRMAINKAQYIGRKNPEKWIIGADTIISTYGRTTLGKPKDKKEALSILKKLCGQTHEVMTGICLCNMREETIIHHVESTEVTFINTTEKLLKAYIATQEPMDKAGAYAIQGLGSILIKKINGSYSNVVGLPLSKMTSMLMEYKIICPQNK